MIHDVYEVARAGGRNLLQLERVTNNLANVSTPGYKGDRLSFILEGKAKGKAGAVSSYTPVFRTNFTTAALLKTGQPLDLALDSPAFFAVETKSGPAYMKGGSFTLDGKKQLVTKGGNTVLGENGPLTLTGKEIYINHKGEVFSDGNPVDRLRLVEFDREDKLKKLGDGQYRAPDGDGGKRSENPGVKSGYLEMSNVNGLKEMIELIDLQRAMEIYQKVIHTLQDLDKISVNRVGKLT